MSSDLLTWFLSKKFIGYRIPVFDFIYIYIYIYIYIDIDINIYIYINQQHFAIQRCNLFY